MSADTDGITFTEDTQLEEPVLDISEEPTTTDSEARPRHESELEGGTEACTGNENELERGTGAMIGNESELEGGTEASTGDEEDAAQEDGHEQLSDT